MNSNSNISSDAMGNQTTGSCVEHVGLSAYATHHECRECLKQVWGEPTKMVKGSLWYYTNGEEQFEVFMPFTERTPKSAVYDYSGREGKVRIRRNEHRTGITVECPNNMGVEAIDALWNAEATRMALKGAYIVERESNGVDNEKTAQHQ